MVIDYLIIGQGLCGTFLSRSLIKAGKKVLVIDDDKPFTASKVASGVINPVTGRRIVTTWRIEELMPFAWDAYKNLGEDIEAELVQPCNMLDFHASLQMKEAFESRLQKDPRYLQIPLDACKWEKYFNYFYGVGEINPCLLVDITTMLSKWREKLKQQDSLLEEHFAWHECKVEQHQVTYKNITAEKIICCEGVAGFQNPFFNNLPYTRMKGEAVIASIPGLSRQNIYKHGISIVPWKDDLFWIGSTYEWDFKDVQPTPAYRKKVEELLSRWLKLPFTIVDHLASERPANIERRPFVGLHPQYPAVGVFNGMGAKGCSIAPFFANQFTNNLLHRLPLYPDADVKRFEKVLVRR